jgi:hypothetical protein
MALSSVNKERSINLKGNATEEGTDQDAHYDVRKVVTIVHRSRYSNKSGQKQRRQTEESLRKLLLRYCVHPDQSVSI